jgi:hypothetical protein
MISTTVFVLPMPFSVAAGQGRQQGRPLGAIPVRA